MTHILAADLRKLHKNWRLLLLSRITNDANALILSSGQILSKCD